jgi:hypothetical protein
MYDKPELAFHTICSTCDKWVYQFWTDGENSFCGLCRTNLGKSHEVALEMRTITEIQNPPFLGLVAGSKSMVKRYRAKKELRDAMNKKRFLWHEGDMLTQVQPASEYYRPSSITPPDPRDEHECCLGYALHQDTDRWDEYYEEFPPIEFKDAPTFNFFKVRSQQELKRLEESLAKTIARIKDLKELYE